MRSDVKRKAESDDPETFLEDCLDSYGNGCGENNSVVFRLHEAEYSHVRYVGECDKCGMEHMIEYDVGAISAMNMEASESDE